MPLARGVGFFCSASMPAALRTMRCHVLICCFVMSSQSHGQKPVISGYSYMPCMKAPVWLCALLQHTAMADLRGQPPAAFTVLQCFGFQSFSDAFALPIIG